MEAFFVRPQGKTGLLALKPCLSSLSAAFYCGAAAGQMGRPSSAGGLIGARRHRRQLR